MNRLTGTTRGGVFSCRAGDLAWAHAPAAATEILFRPAAIRITAPAAAPLQGTITAASFLGDRTRLLVEAGSAHSLVAESIERRDFPSSAARRVGKECVSMCTSRGSPHHPTNN